MIGAQVTQCLAAARGRFIDPDAAPLCGRLIGAQVTACIGAIAGKDYEPDQANSCGSLIGAQVVECFRRTGRAHYDAPPPPPPPPDYPPPSYEMIRVEIAGAIEQLRSNDQRGAEIRLRRLLSILRSVP